ncbi:hypothetical protein ACWDZ8_28000, partial [Streptomyces sp. NPDC003233]
MGSHSWKFGIGLAVSTVVIAGGAMAPAAMADTGPVGGGSGGSPSSLSSVHVGNGSVRIGDSICAGDCNGTVNGAKGAGGGICAGLCNGSANGGDGTAGAPGRNGGKGGDGG